MDLSTNLTPEPTAICGHENCGKTYSEHVIDTLYSDTDRYCFRWSQRQSMKTPRQLFTPAAPVPVKETPDYDTWKNGAVEPVGSERIIPNVTAPDGLAEQSLRIKLVTANARVADLTREKEETNSVLRLVLMDIIELQDRQKQSGNYVMSFGSSRTLIEKLLNPKP